MPRIKFGSIPKLGVAQGRPSCQKFWLHKMEMIRKCTESDLNEIFKIINDAAQVYKGVIPDDRWREPYMPIEELRHEIEDGVIFWSLEQDGGLTGVMGIQDRGDVTLIRHAYVLTQAQKRGIGTRLLRHLESMTKNPILVGTWADASWAIAFYKSNGYDIVSEKEKNCLLRKYWSIPKRQVQTSVVLASQEWKKIRPDAPAHS